MLIPGDRLIFSPTMLRKILYFNLETNPFQTALKLYFASESPWDAADAAGSGPHVENHCLQLARVSVP